MKDQKDAFCRDPEAEKKNEFRCVADYLTTKTDLGWTAWQFVNSYHDWTKKMGTMSRSVKYSCGTASSLQGVVVEGKEEGIV
jgi:predicted metalloprotease